MFHGMLFPWVQWRFNGRRVQLLPHNLLEASEIFVGSSFGHVFLKQFCATKVLILSTDSRRQSCRIWHFQEVGSVWVLTLPSSYINRLFFPLPQEKHISPDFFFFYPSLQPCSNFLGHISNKIVFCSKPFLPLNSLPCLRLRL